MWDRRAKLLLLELRHKDVVNDAAYSPDGRRIITSSDDRTAQVWDAQTGEALLEPLAHDDAVNRAVFSPAGDRIATAAADGTARIWDPVSAKPLTDPLRHGSRVLHLQFSADGRQIVTGTANQAVQVWDLPRFDGRIPPWVVELAEAVAGVHIDGRGVSKNPASSLLDVQQRVAGLDASELWARWGLWFFAHHSTRSLSAFTGVPVSEYSGRRIEANTAHSLREAFALSRTNGLALARLARLILAQRPGSEALAEADLYTRRAAELSPADAEVLSARALALLVSSRPSEALDQADRAIGLTLRGATNQPEPKLKRLLMLRRSILLRLDRVQDAQEDSAALFGTRPAGAGFEMIDLSSAYNMALAELTPGRFGTAEKTNVELPGIIVLDRVRFDVRAAVHLGSDERQAGARVQTVAIGRLCRRLHFLEGVATRNRRRSPGSCVLHFADGSSQQLQVMYGQHGWGSLETAKDTIQNSSPVGLAAVIPGDLSGERRLTVFKATRENPKPEVAIRAIDFVVDPNLAAVFLIAISVEPQL